MTEQEMRIAVAESLGLTCDKDGNWSLPSGHYCPNGTPPNYPQDLNAIRDVILHECEIGGYGFQADYQLKLQVVVERRRRDLTREQIGFWMNNASAAECTETYLRVKGLWK